MHNFHMEDIGFSRSPSVIAQRARRAGLTQEQIAKAVSASQSQVSRVLAGKSIRQSRLYDEICVYVNNALRGVSPEAVCENKELIDALANVWDGTGHHATALATVIRSLGELNTVAGRRRATSIPSAKEVTNADT
jgi:transcriptional regulator with XRE-family HTH domain